jgi:hypothetical protein
MKKLILLNPPMRALSRRRRRRTLTNPRRRIRRNPARRAAKAVRRKRRSSSRRKGGFFARIGGRADSSIKRTRRASGRHLSRFANFVGGTRRTRRRRIRRNPAGDFTSSITGGFKDLFSSSLLELAGGYFLGSGVSNALIGSVGASLPGASSPYGRLAYRVATPLVLIPLVNMVPGSSNMKKGISQGLVLSAGITLLNGLIGSFNPAISAAINPPNSLSGYMDALSFAGGQRSFRPMNAYLGRRPGVRPMNAYLGRRPGVRPMNAYLGANRNRGMRPMGAFAPARGHVPLISGSGANPLSNTGNTFNNPAF